MLGSSVMSGAASRSIKPKINEMNDLLKERRRVKIEVPLTVKITSRTGSALLKYKQAKRTGRSKPRL